MSQEIIALSAPALGLTQSSFSFFAANQSYQLPTDPFENLNVKQATPSADAFFKPSDQYIEQLKEALKLAGTPTTLSRVLPKIHIGILPEEAMQKYTNIEDFSAAYAPTYSTILLNEHLFKPGNESRQQLAGVLRNELSHAAVHLTQKEIYKIKGSLYELVKPWENPTQEKKLLKAYELFEKRIARHQKLSKIPHKNLSHEERKELIRYRRALDSFKPKQLGSDGYNVMQIFIKRNQESQAIEIYKNLQSKPPPRGKIKQRRRYMETAFFREKEHLSLHGMVSEGPYAATGDATDRYKLWADKVSDFDQFSPAMQRTFGIELCDYLRDFHQSSSHCDYSLSP